MEFIDLAKQQLLIREKLEMRIKKVLDSGKYIMGFEIIELEEKLAEFVGVQHCISCSSGIDALLIPLIAKGIGPGHAVFTTPFTFVATAEVFSLVGATPVFVDVDRSTWTMDPQSFKAAITKNTKAVMPVHLYGHPAKMDVIKKIADDLGLKILEDAAPAIGATLNNKFCGTFGNISAFD